jgi:formylglycine-generating enzyme required for sulfatase activity
MYSVVRIGLTLNALLLSFACVDASEDEPETTEDCSDEKEFLFIEKSPCYLEGEPSEGKDFACDWTTVEGGDFMMGSPEGMGEEDREYPQHLVTLPTFELWRTENTVKEYIACVDDGWCVPLAENYFCNATYPEERADFPICCINWYNARDFCHWLGGRLPTEAEWEFAARSRGKDTLYAWGDEDPTCELAVIDVKYLDETLPSPAGCDGLNTTQPVCSKPLGNSEQGFCDFVGNVYEWVEDCFHPAYEYTDDEGVTHTAPADGSAWIDPMNEDDFRIMRGGGIGSPGVYRATFRQIHDGAFSYGGLGVRCARDIGVLEAD